MATVVERTPSGIIYRSPHTRQLPQLDLLTYIFDTPHIGPRATEDVPLHLDADDPSKRLTKLQQRQLFKRTAHTFRHQYGIGRDGPNKDVVLFITTGCWLIPTIFYATIAAGGISSASGPSSTASEMAGHIKLVSSKLIVCNEDTKEVARGAAKLAGFPLSRVLVIGDGHELQLTNLETNRPIPISPQQLDWDRITDTAVLENSVICILFSSGTTGLPKGIKISHANLVSSASLMVDTYYDYDHAHGRILINPSALAHVPAGHIAGVVFHLVLVPYRDVTTYWMRRFDFGKFLQYNRQYRITDMFTVPPIALLIATSPHVTDQFSHMTDTFISAAPLSAEVEAGVRKRFPREANVGQMFGMSELTGAVSVKPRGLENRPGSSSCLLPNVKMRVVDDDGKDAEPGRAGELLVHSPTTVKGYLNNKEADRYTFVDGWMHTGDIGLFRDGYLYIVDRKKELIKYKGSQVAPSELEGLLLTHPQIQDAAVIGVPGQETELPRAYVVADQTKITAKEIQDWVAGQVANPKRLRGGVVFLPSIPKSPSGKVLKKILKDMVKGEGRQSHL